ncbi:hypothetical protein B0H14DRAFT_3857368 [Mycena olivaceomarginata]|nr:hypothetical protein B0H14DRAFT_3857368 [Mycena olivaceomarginata]
MASKLPSIALMFPELVSFPSQDIQPPHSASMPPYSPRLYPDPVTIPDEFSRYSDFKYRLWFIWYIWHRTTGNKWEPPWPAIDEDEEAIRKFVNQDLRVSVILQMPVTAWNAGCQALEARLSPATVAAIRIWDNAEFLKHHWEETRRCFVYFMISLSLLGLSSSGWLIAPRRMIESNV